MKIHSIVKSLRTIPIKSVNCLKFPAKITNDVIYGENSSILFRRRVVLNVPGCKVRSCTMCNLPEDAPNISYDPPLEDWLSQLQYSISKEDRIDVLTLFHNGNFFNPAEVSHSIIKHLMLYLSTTRIKRLVVESLPQYITEDVVSNIRSWLGPDIKLEVAIGLQCQDDFLRKHAVGSTCTSFDFINAKSVLAKYDYKVQTFVMYGIPFLTTSESSNELLLTLDWLLANDVHTPTICPLHIVPGTVAFELLTRTLYKAPDYAELGYVLNKYLTSAPSYFKPRVARSLISNTDDLYYESLLKYITLLNQQKSILFDAFEWPTHELISYNEEDILQRIRDFESLF